MIVTIDTDAETVTIRGVKSFSDLLDFTDYDYFDVIFEDDDAILGHVDQPFTETTAT